MNLHTIFFVVSLAAWQPAGADRELPWPRSDNPRVSIDDKGTVTVQGAAGRTQTHLLTVEAPQVPSHQYRLVGRIKYEGVDGAGYVEMWNRFPGRGEFFTRTLAEAGSLGKLTGSSDWRDLELPFMSDPGVLPDRLTIHLVLAGRGKVWITPLRLDEWHVPGDVEIAREPFALVALLLGIAALATALLGMFSRTGRIALLLCRIFALVSLVSLLMGLGFRQTSQFTHFARPLALCGGVGTILFLAGILILRKKFAQEERRRMQAMDVTAE